MITKKTIQKQIEELERYILWYRKHIEHFCDDAEKAGFVVYKDGDYAAIYCKNYTQISSVTNDLSRTKGTIDGLQMAIDQLKKLL